MSLIPVNKQFKLVILQLGDPHKALLYAYKLCQPLALSLGWLELISSIIYNREVQHEIGANPLSVSVSMLQRRFNVFY